MDLLESARGILYRRNLARLRRHIRVFVLGNQKTGSTIIAASLAKLADLPVTLDVKGAIKNPQWKVDLSKGKGSFDAYLYRHRNELAVPIVKEPGLTFYYPELNTRFPEAGYVMIVRHPMDNIRSILNRLEVPGDLQELDPDRFPRLRDSLAWRINFDGSWLGIESQHYISVLAQRWVITARHYLESSCKFSLLKYEDFCSDKAGAIHRLCRELGLTPKSQIKDFVDTQLQSKGDNVEDYVEFFGQKNCQLLLDICSVEAKALGYDL